MIKTVIRVTEAIIVDLVGETKSCKAAVARRQGYHLASHSAPVVGTPSLEAKNNPLILTSLFSRRDAVKQVFLRVRFSNLRR